MPKPASSGADSSAKCFGGGGESEFKEADPDKKDAAELVVQNKQSPGVGILWECLQGHPQAVEGSACGQTHLETKGEYWESVVIPHFKTTGMLKVR